MPIDDPTVLAAPASDEAAFSALAERHVQAPGATSYDAFALGVLRIEQGRIAEITAFGPELFAAFGLPPTW